MNGENMKTVKHEIKLERSVKIILAVFAVGVLLNAFATPIGEELFGVKEAQARGTSGAPVYIVCMQGCR